MLDDLFVQFCFSFRVISWIVSISAANTRSTKSHENSERQNTRIKSTTAALFHFRQANRV